jgi:hypothetical protein
MATPFLFTSGNGATIPPGENLVRTTGHSIEGRGQADYVHDAALTAADATNNPQTIFTAADGRRFKLTETVRTPWMFGCTGASTGADTVALQAFFNDAFAAANAASCVYDWSGSWTVNAQLYACYPSDWVPRRFVCGKLVVVPLSSLGGTAANALDAVLTISGNRQHWYGQMDIQHAVPFLHYADRAFRNGVRFYGAGNSTFGTINVDSARRNAVDFHRYTGTPTTFQAGTPQEITVSQSNNIGIVIERIKGWYVGAYRGSANTAYTQTITAVTQVGTSNFVQYSELAVGSTAELRPLDFFTTALEHGISTYTSIATDNATSRIIWTSGDPVAAGYAAGDVVVMQGGSNAGTEFTIQGFGGTSNREITVVPAPATQAATATITRVQTRDTWHLITEIPSAGVIRAFPWLDSRLGAGTILRSAHGFVADVQGADTASIEIGSLDGLVSAGTLRSAGLYGVTVQNLQVDHGSIGIVIGSVPLSASLGHAIDHCHLEGVEVDILWVTLGDAKAVIKAPSAIGGGAQDPFSRVVKLNPRSSFTNQIDDRATLQGLSLLIGGDRYDGMATNSYAPVAHNDYYVSNQPKLRDQHIPANSTNINLQWYDMIARRLGGHHRARLLWTGPTGGIPSGTLTFKRDANMVARAWKIMGTAADYTLQNGGIASVIEIVFDNANKNVVLVRFAAV